MLLHPGWCDGPIQATVKWLPPSPSSLPCKFRMDVSVWIHIRPAMSGLLPPQVWAPVPSPHGDQSPLCAEEWDRALVSHPDRAFVCYIMWQPGWWDSSPSYCTGAFRSSIPQNHQKECGHMIMWPLDLWAVLINSLGSKGGFTTVNDLSISEVIVYLNLHP